MTAKEKVLAVYETAKCEKIGYLAELGGELRTRMEVGIPHGEMDSIEIGHGETEEAAWQNAAESLPAQPEQETSVCVKCGHIRGEHFFGGEYCDMSKMQAASLYISTEQTFEEVWNKFTAGNDPDEWNARDAGEYFWNASKGLK